MKIEIDFDEETIRTAVQTWTERAAANALDDYLTGALRFDVHRKTEAIVQAKLQEYFKDFDVSPQIEKLMASVSAHGQTYLADWAKREGKRQGKLTLEKAAAIHTQQEG
jgi:sulfur relay (sulfurtransferase) DsrC/TusE family protein